MKRKDGNDKLPRVKQKITKSINVLTHNWVTPLIKV
jgi:hypothetical protein